jgi:hypothetical protein
VKNKALALRNRKNQHMNISLMCVKREAKVAQAATVNFLKVSSQEGKMPKA